MPNNAVTTFIALLRAVNVGGNNMVAMAELRKLTGELGFADVRSLLQSGNLVFSGHVAATPALEKRLEKEVAARLGVTTDFFVRTAKEWAAIVAGNLFPEEARRDPGRLVVVCLKDEQGRAKFDALQAAIRGREVVRGSGRQAYIYYPDGQGRSKLTSAVIERQLGTRCTARNWNTVLKLAAMANEEQR